MNNKVLVKLIVPECDSSFDIFIPVNELVWKVKKLALKAVNDLTNNSLDMNSDYVLLNKLTSQIYPNNSVIYDTDIRNASELIMLAEKTNNGTFVAPVNSVSQNQGAAFGPEFGNMMKPTSMNPNPANMNQLGANLNKVN